MSAMKATTVAYLWYNLHFPKVSGSYMFGDTQWPTG